MQLGEARLIITSYLSISDSKRFIAVSIRVSSRQVLSYVLAPILSILLSCKMIHLSGYTEFAKVFREITLASVSINQLGIYANINAFIAVIVHFGLRDSTRILCNPTVSQCITF